MYGISLSLKTTITGDIQIEITGAAFLLRKIVLMSGLAIRGVEGREGLLLLLLEETVNVFSLQMPACVCVCVCVCVCIRVCVREVLEGA